MSSYLDLIYIGIVILKILITCVIDSHMLSKSTAHTHTAAGGRSRRLPNVPTAHGQAAAARGLTSLSEKARQVEALFWTLSKNYLSFIIDAI